MAKNTTDPVQMLTDISKGFEEIGQTFKLVLKNRELVTELKILRKEFILLEAKVQEYGKAAVDAENKAERAAKKSLDSAKKRRKDYEDANKKSTGYLNDLAVAAKRQIAWYPVKAVTTSFLSALRSIPTITAEYGQALKDISSISRMSDKDLSTLSKTIVEVGVSTKFSMVEVAKSTKILTQAGLRGAELSNALQPLAELAAATSSTLDNAAQLQTTVMRAYSMGADQFNEISDGIVNSIASTRLSLQDLNTAFSYVASAAQQTGVSFTETLTLLGLLKNAGLEASTAATGLRMALLKITAPTRKAQKVLDSVGLSKKDLDIANRGIYEVLKSLNKLTKQSIIDIFGARSANAMLVFRNVSMETAKQLEKVIKLQGTAAYTAAEQMSTLAGQWKLLYDNLKAAAVSIGDSFKTFVIDNIQVSIELLSKAVKAFRQWKRVLASIASVYALYKGIPILLKGIAIASEALIKVQVLLIASFSKVGKAVTLVKYAFNNYGKYLAFAQRQVAAFSAVSIGLGVVFAAIGATLITEAKNLATFKKNLDELATSFTKTKVTLEEFTLKFSELKDLQLGSSFENAFIVQNRGKIKENINSYYSSILKIVGDPKRKEEIALEQQKLLEDANKILTMDDAQAINKIIDARSKNEVKVIKESRKKTAATLEADMGVAQDLSFGFDSSIFSPKVAVSEDRSLQIMDETISKFEKSQSKLIDLASDPAFKKSQNLLIGSRKDLETAQSNADARLKVYISMLDNEKVLVDGLANLQRRKAGLAGTLSLDQWLDLNKLEQEHQDALDTLHRIRNAELTGELASMVAPVNKMSKKLMIEARETLLRDMNTELNTAKDDNERRAILNKYFRNFDKNFKTEFANLFTKVGNYDKWAEKLQEPIEDAVNKGKFVITGKAFGLDINTLRRDANEFKAEAAAIMASIYEDNVVIGDEWNSVKESRTKSHTARMKEIQIAYLTDLKNGMTQAQAIKMKALRQDKENSKYLQTLTTDNQKNLQQYVKSYNDTVKTLNISDLKGVIKVDALKQAQDAAVLAMQNILASNAFDPDDKKSVDLIQKLADEIVRLGIQIKNTDKTIASSKIGALGTQISSLSKQRDYLESKGQDIQVIEMNKQLLDLYKQQTEVKIAMYKADTSISPDVRESLIKSAQTDLLMFMDALDPALSKAAEDFQTFKDGVTDGFSSFFSSLIEGTMSVSDSFKQLGLDILKTFQDIITQRIAEKLFESIAGEGGWISSIFKHGGGSASQGGSRKLVNPMVFAGAPRLHSGLKTNEFPAVLERGETVISKRGTINGSPVAPAVSVNVINQVGDADFDGEKYVLDIILKAKTRGNATARQIFGS